MGDLCSGVSKGLAWSFPCPILLLLPLFLRIRSVSVWRLSLPKAACGLYLPFIFHRFHLSINLLHSHLPSQSWLPRGSKLTHLHNTSSDLFSSFHHDREILLAQMYSVSPSQWQPCWNAPQRKPFIMTTKPFPNRVLDHHVVPAKMHLVGVTLYTSTPH